MDSKCFALDWLDLFCPIKHKGLFPNFISDIEGIWENYITCTPPKSIRSYLIHSNLPKNANEIWSDAK